jgi:hypothetical protein
MKLVVIRRQGNKANLRTAAVQRDAEDKRSSHEVSSEDDEEEESSQVEDDFADDAVEEEEHYVTAHALESVLAEYDGSFEGGDLALNDVYDDDVVKVQPLPEECIIPLDLIKSVDKMDIKCSANVPPTKSTPSLHFCIPHPPKVGVIPLSTGLEMPLPQDERLPSSIFGEFTGDASLEPLPSEDSYRYGQCTKPAPLQSHLTSTDWHVSLGDSEFGMLPSGAMETVFAQQQPFMCSPRVVQMMRL